MRKVFAPVVPVCSLFAVTVGLMVLAVPLARLIVEVGFSALGY